MSNKLIGLLIITVVLFHHMAAIKVLGIGTYLISLPLRSHYAARRELSIQGHHVTVMNNFPDDKPLTNLRFIDLQGYA